MCRIRLNSFWRDQLPKRYAVIFCDAMYVHLRRDSVAGEFIHVLLIITPEGHKEILDYAILPSESALNYADMLKSLKIRGLEQVLFVSDGLVGLPRRYRTPRSSTRVAGFISCACRPVRPSAEGRPDARLKRVYRQENAALAQQELSAFPRPVWNKVQATSCFHSE